MSNYDKYVAIIVLGTIACLSFYTVPDVCQEIVIGCVSAIAGFVTGVSYKTTPDVKK